jgi:NADH:ubiquinone oxidoreductase subunit D
MEFYERVSGARMHAAFHRPTAATYVNVDLTLLSDVSWFIKNCFTTLNEMHNLLTFNKV